MAPDLRRGLPRTRGGEPWPSQSAIPEKFRAARVEVSTGQVLAPSVPKNEVQVLASSAPAEGVSRLRRGLPRVSNGEPWPPDAAIPVSFLAPVIVVPTIVMADTPPPAAEAIPTPAQAAPTVQVLSASPAVASRRRPSNSTDRRKSLLTPANARYAGIILGAVLLGAAAIAAARWLMTLSDVKDFVGTYPGEYDLPSWAPVGLPAWLGWQHFLSAFFILLIIRTGLQVRNEKRPPASWTPRRPAGVQKISLTLWSHLAVDSLWMLNGVLFIVLLFVTGQWVRIVPTSWAVAPNAVSAVLQYASLNWPTEDGWINYNSLQQLSYFTTVFVAAPLAIATGFRMSYLWPRRAGWLSKAYPVELARAIHFPVMLYFSAFTVVHVTLVLATGALRNLNHMYGGQDAVNWTGFWIFLLSLVVMAAGLLAVRPLVMSSIAGLFGRVGR
jgi:thiosulfate reductase cytochrome b subunit